MSAEDGYCSTGTDSVDDQAAAESPCAGQKRELASPSSPLPPPKCSRRSVEKRVNGEGPPLPDSWAWSKYGQKPIKGSPYSRGFSAARPATSTPAPWSLTFAGALRRTVLDVRTTNRL